MKKKIIAILGSILIIISFLICASWDGSIAERDMKDIYGGLNRTIKIYTANGDLMAEYSGKINIDINDGGYVRFDYDGKRYIYYNCFIESITDK